MLAHTLTINNSLCSYLTMIRWLQSYLIPCPLKYLTGWDCPLCGFQRSVLAMMQGQWKQSFQLYPAAVPVLVTALYLAIKNIVPFSPSKLYANLLISVTVTLIFMSYAAKLLHLF